MSQELWKDTVKEFQEIANKHYMDMARQTVLDKVKELAQYMLYKKNNESFAWFVLVESIKGICGKHIPESTLRVWVQEGVHRVFSTPLPDDWACECGVLNPGFLDSCFVCGEENPWLQK